MKFTVPMVANGDVYVGTGNSLVMYGLNTPPTAAPAAPSNLTVTSASGSEVSLSWTNNATNSSDRVGLQHRTLHRRRELYPDRHGSEWIRRRMSTHPCSPSRRITIASMPANSIGTSAYTNVVNAETLGQPVRGWRRRASGSILCFGGNPFASSAIHAAGNPTLTRVDPTIDFNWNYRRPLAGCRADELRGRVDRRSSGPVLRKLHVLHGSATTASELLDQRARGDQRLRPPFTDRGTLPPRHWPCKPAKAMPSKSIIFRPAEAPRWS